MIVYFSIFTAERDGCKMNKHQVKWLSLILSIAVFVGCAVYISTASRVSANTDITQEAQAQPDLPVYTFGDVVAGDIVQGSYDEYIDDETGEVYYSYSDWLGDSSDPLIVATKVISQNTNGDYVISYSFRGEYLLEIYTNYIFVDLSSEDEDVRAGVINSVQGYIDYLNEFTSDVNTSQFVIQAIGADNHLNILLPEADDDDPLTLTPGQKAAVYLHDSEADLHADPANPPATPTKAELETIVTENDLNSDFNIIIIAENADEISVEPTKAHGLFTAVIDPDIEPSAGQTVQEAVLADVGSDQLLSLNLCDYTTVFDIRDEVNAPYAVKENSAKATLTTPYSDERTIPVGENGSGLVKASYSVPPIGEFSGTFEYVIEANDLEAPVSCSDLAFTATEAFAFNDPSSDYDLITLPNTVIETEIPIMSINKKVSFTGTTVNKDSVLNYEIIVKNEGNVDLTKVGLTDTLICSGNVDSSSVLATTGSGSSTKTFSFTPSQSSASSTGTLNAADLTLAPGAELTVSYKFNIPDNAAGCEEYKSTVDGATKYIIPNTATAKADELDSTVADSTYTEILGISDSTDNSSGNASGNTNKDEKPSDGTASGNASGDSKGDDDKKDESPATGDTHNIIAIVLMVVAFIAGCVSLFLIINEKKVQALIKSSAK